MFVQLERIRTKLESCLIFRFSSMQQSAYRRVHANRKDGVYSCYDHFVVISFVNVQPYGLYRFSIFN